MNVEDRCYSRDRCCLYDEELKVPLPMVGMAFNIAIARGVPYIMEHLVWKL